MSHHFGKELTRRRSSDAAEVRNHMGLVIVSSADRNLGPVCSSAILCRLESTLESQQLEKRLRAQSDHFTKQPAQVSLADAQVLGDGSNIAAGETSGGTLHQPRIRVEAACRLKPRRDCRLQCDDGRACISGGGKLFFQTLRGCGVPQITKRDDAAGEFRGGSAQHCLIRAQWQPGNDCSLAAANQLAVNVEPWTQRVDVESARYMRAESHDQMHARARNRDPCPIRLALIYKDIRRPFRYGGAGLTGKVNALKHTPLSAGDGSYASVSGSYNPAGLERLTLAP